MKEKFTKYISNKWINDLIQVLFFSSLALLFSILKTTIPGIDYTAADFREIPLIISLIYLRNPFYTLVISFLVSLNIDGVGTFPGNVIMHSVSLFFTWYILRYLISIKYSLYLKTLLCALVVIFYYLVLLIPSAIISFKLTGVVEESFINAYKSLFILGRFEIVATTLISALYLMQYLIQLTLKETNNELVHHKTNLEELVKIRTNEINLKSISLEQKQKEIIEYNEHIKASIRYARTIQLAMLPPDNYVDKELKNFILYLPKDIVSGDFYWFAKTDKYIFVVLADCTGHGVPGGFMSMIGLYLLQIIVVENQIYDTVSIANELNNRLLTALKQETTLVSDGMDIAICRVFFNDKNQNISFTGARSSIIYYSSENKKATQIKGDRKSIGDSSRPNVYFTNHSINLCEGDCYYLFSDGLVDQNNSLRKKFGYKRLMTVIEDFADFNIEIQKENFLKTITQFKDNEVLRDDLSLIGIKV